MCVHLVSCPIVFGVFCLTTLFLCVFSFENAWLYEVLIGICRAALLFGPGFCLHFHRPFRPQLSARTEKGASDKKGEKVPITLQRATECNPSPLDFKVVWSSRRRLSTL